jgi:hypothetical protein
VETQHLVVLELGVADVVLEHLVEVREMAISTAVGLDCVEVEAGAISHLVGVRAGIAVVVVVGSSEFEVG